MSRRYSIVMALVCLATGSALHMPAAFADGEDSTVVPNNKRLTDGVVANVYTVQHQAGCSNDVRKNSQLQQAAQRHADDLINDRSLDGDLGSDGSTAQDRANAAGYRGAVAQTVAINPALAISGVELINQWYNDPADLAIMSNCANCEIGVWSENSLDRTVVVAVYGRHTTTESTQAVPDASPTGCAQGNLPMDPAPDYDASDELEYGIGTLPWILRGVYPPPGIPPA